MIGLLLTILVFITLFFERIERRIKILSVGVILCVLTEYLLILSNANISLTQEIGLGTSPYSIPWYRSFDLTEEQIDYYNLKVDRSAMLSIFYELAVSSLIFLYFRYFSHLSIMHSVVISPLYSIADEESLRPEKSTIERIANMIKRRFYDISHIVILIIVLLFVSQNYGILSLIYCIISFTIIFRINSLYAETVESFFLLSITKLFIKFLTLDLILQGAYQLPIAFLHSEQDDFWTKSIGVYKIDAMQPNQFFLAVLLKIAVFVGLYLMNRLMTTKDFLKYRDLQRHKIKNSPRELGLKLAQHFNNSRLKAIGKYFIDKNRFEDGLKALSRNIEKWNNKFLAQEQPRRQSLIHNVILKNYVRNVATTGIPKLANRPEPKFEENTYKSKFQQLLICFINPILFKKFMKKLKTQEKHFPSAEVELHQNQFAEELEQSMISEKSRVEETKSDESGDEFEEAANLEDYISQKEYDFTLADYLYLFVLIIASNTEALVFLCFFINHYTYCSLVSVLLPISVLLYAMLDNPRTSYLYFKTMLIYLEIVFFLKFAVELDIWKNIFGDDIFLEYTDPWKIGIARAYSTYSESLLLYTLWDLIAILFLLIHDFYLGEVGLKPYSEYNLETLEEAKIRKWGIETIVTRVRSSSCSRVLSYFKRLVPTDKTEKPGVRLHLLSSFLQFTILIYIFCCFPRIEGHYQDLSESFAANQFSGRMVIAIITHLITMLFDRYLYLSEIVETDSNGNITIKRHPQIIRISLYVILVILVHFLVFWYFPLNGNVTLIGQIDCIDKFDGNRCNNFQVNAYLRIFYLLYLCYFIVIGLQIKYGLPSLKTGELPLQQSTSRLSRYFFTAYRSIPFLFELRTFMDWTFTKTALDIFQWIKFEDITAEIYLARCYQKMYREHIRGEPMPLWYKTLIGCSGLFAILFLILVPLILFSSLNPITELNPIIAVEVNIGLKTQNSNSYNLYTVSRVIDIHYISDEEWRSNHFNRLQQVQANDKFKMQVMTMLISGDTLWNISPASQDKLCNSLETYPHSVYTELQYSFTRRYPYEEPVVNANIQNPLSEGIVKEIHQVICNHTNNKTDFTLQTNQIIFFRIPSAGTNISPIRINSGIVVEGISMEMVQLGLGVKYWNAATSGSGIKIYTVSEDYSLATSNFSVLTFYISVVYVIGRLLRYTIGGGAKNLNITDMPFPHKLLDICKAIYINRSTGNLLSEEEYYYELIDILRSTEMTRYLTYSSSVKVKSD